MVEQLTFQTIFQFLQTVGILMGVYYYIMTIRTNQRNQEIAQKNQELTLKAQEQALETRQAQIFMQIFDQSYNDPSFIKAWYRYQKLQWNNIEDWERTLDPDDPEGVLNREALGRVALYFEGLGVLVKENYVHIRLIALLMTGMVVTFWEKQIPIVDEARKLRNRARDLSEAEYLYNELMKYLEEHPELKT